MESTRSNNRGFSSEGALVPSVVWRLLVSGVMALAFLVVDQVSKMIVRRAVMTGFFSVELIPGVLGLEFVANRGAAFGLGEGMGWVFVLLAVGVTAFVLVYLLRAPKISRLEVLGMGMVVGGAIGNAIDRLVFGFVTDFFATRFIDFPVFNVADIGITCGVAIAFIGFMFFSPAAHEHNDSNLQAGVEDGSDR